MEPDQQVTHEHFIKSSVAKFLNKPQQNEGRFPKPLFCKLVGAFSTTCDSDAHCQSLFLDANFGGFWPFLTLCGFKINFVAIV